MRHVVLAVTHESARMFVENFHEYMERERSEYNSSFNINVNIRESTEIIYINVEVNTSQILESSNTYREYFTSFEFYSKELFLQSRWRERVLEIWKGTVLIFKLSLPTFEQLIVINKLTLRTHVGCTKHFCVNNNASMLH